MASIYETGHLKNITHFGELITAATNFGPVYAPTNPNIALAALNDKKTAAETALFQTKELETLLVNARGLRRMAFEPLKQTAMRVMAALKASGAPQPTIKAAEAINRKIQGRRAAATPKPDDKDIKTISVSQQSYDRQADFLQELIVLLQAEPAYNPNEPELKVSALTLFQQTLINANKEVSNTYFPFSNALIARNKILYEPQVGLVQLAADVKLYPKSVFGSQSPQYAQLKAITFKNVSS